MYCLKYQTLVLEELRVTLVEMIENLSDSSKYDVTVETTGRSNEEGISVSQIRLPQDHCMRTGDLIALMSSGNKSVLAIVANVSNDKKRIILKFKSTASVGVQSLWTIVRLCSSSTSIRELVATQSASRGTHSNRIGLTRRTEMHQRKERFILKPNADSRFLSSMLNLEQSAAIERAMAERITLIQGPPGTGKTRVVAYLVNTALSARWYRGNSTGDSAKACVDRLAPVRILVCCPSNAATDVALEKLLEVGAFDVDLSVPRMRPFRRGEIVRVGDESAMSVEAKKVCVSSLIHDREIRALHRKKSHARCHVVDNARIVFTTLSSAARSEMTTIATSVKRQGFDVVIVDEACQATEPSTLIALDHLRDEHSKLILIGDSKQLPATVRSRHAEALGLGVSLFERLTRSAIVRPTALRVQYRMHPLIRAFPSVQFYQNSLLDKPFSKDATAMPWRWHPCHEGARSMFKPWVLFNMQSPHRRNESDGCSYENPREATFCADLYAHFLSKFETSDFAMTFGIITPYSGQVKRIRAALRIALRNRAPLSSFRVATVDSFQGSEQDFVILSCVRSFASSDRGSAKPTIGFLCDRRRLNVALTRARFGVWIVGDMHFLAKHKDWAAMVSHAQSQSCLVDVPPGGFDELRRKFETGEVHISTSTESAKGGAMSDPTDEASLPVITTSSEAAATGSAKRRIRESAPAAASLTPDVAVSRSKRRRYDDSAHDQFERWSLRMEGFLGTVPTNDVALANLLRLELLPFADQISISLLQSVAGKRLMRSIQATRKQKSTPLARRAAILVRRAWKLALDPSKEGGGGGGT